MHTPFTRRTVLKGAGVTIALPLMEVMQRAIGSESIAPPKRMVLICNTLGLHPASLFPKTSGRDYQTTEYLKVLEKHRKDFTLISGLSHPDQTGKQPHDTELTWLTSARNPGLGGFRNSISVDQFAAAKLGQVTRCRSIALSTNTQKSQSYNANGVMLPAEQRPSAVFEKLFLEGSVEEKKQTRQKLSDGKSVLDLVGDQTRQLQRRASRNDQHQLEEYYSAIRSAETELLESEAWLNKPKPKVNRKPPEDVGDLRDLIGRTESLLNLIPLILQTDSTRVITMVIQDHGVVPLIDGVKAEHHNLSHHGQDPDKIKQLKKIEGELLGCFSRFLTKMSAPHENDHRLLDQTSVLFGSNLGNANAHDPRNLPIMVAGGGYEHGKYLAHDQTNNVPLSNLFVSLLSNLGVETDSFGTSTGRLEI